MHQGINILLQRVLLITHWNTCAMVVYIFFSQDQLLRCKYKELTELTLTCVCDTHCCLASNLKTQLLKQYYCSEIYNQLDCLVDVNQAWLLTAGLTPDLRSAHRSLGTGRFWMALLTCLVFYWLWAGMTRVDWDNDSASLGVTQTYSPSSVRIPKMSVESPNTSCDSGSALTKCPLVHAVPESNSQT